MTKPQSRAEKKEYLDLIRKDWTMGNAAIYGQMELNDRIGFLLEWGDGWRKIAQQASAKTAKDYAANCAIQMGKEPFRQFICARLGASKPEDKAFCEMALKRHLQIKSKKELNTDTLAAGLWRDFLKQYEQWQRNGR